MNKDQQRLLNKALPKLIEQIKVNTVFKAAIYAADILDDDILDETFNEEDSAEVVFQLVQKMKAKGRQDLKVFVSALKQANQADVSDLLQDMTLTFTTQSNPHPKDSETPHKPDQRVKHSAGSTKRPSRETAKLFNDMEMPSTGYLSNLKLDQDYNIRHQQTTHQSLKLPSSEGSGNGGNPSVAELRAGLKDALPPDVYYTQIGDKAVLDNYVQQCSRFERGRTDTIPGPYASPPIGKTTLSRDTVKGISPESAAKMSKLLGGRPTLSYQRFSGGLSLTTLDGTVRYLSIRIHNRQAKEISEDTWCNPDASLADVVAATYGWFPKTVETPTSHYSRRSSVQCSNFTTLNPNQTVLSFWEGSSPNFVIYVKPSDYGK